MKTGILLSLVAAVVLTSPAFACPAHHGKGATKSDEKACETKAPAKDASATSSDSAKTAAPAK